MSRTEQLLAVTPLDGRYAGKVQELRELTPQTYLGWAAELAVK